MHNLNKKFSSAVFGTALAAIFATSVYAAPASNFAASIRQASGEGLHLLHSGVAEAVTSGDKVVAGNSDIVLKTGIKTANKKDLLIGVSLQSGLYTDTKVKGKNGSSETAEAMAGVKVQVVVKDKMGAVVPVYPNEVVFASRVQTLSATLGGVIESCKVSVDPETLTGTINVANDCVVTEEEIGLVMSTTSANHFNFVAPDMMSGDHTVSVVATALSSAEFTNGTFEVTNQDQTTCEGNGGVFSTETDATGVVTEICTFTTADNAAKAWALVDVGTLTVQQVRAINQVGGITTDLDNGTCYDSTGVLTSCTAP